MKKVGVRSQKSGVRNVVLFLFLLFTFHCVSLFPSPARAQPGGGMGGGGGGGGMMQKQERLQELITMRLTSELGLNQDQAFKVSGIMKKYHDQRRMLHQKIQFLNQQLRFVANSNDAKQASQVISDLQRSKDEMDQLDDKMFGEIKPLLTPPQQAKFLLVMQDVRHEMMQVRHGGGMGMQGMPPFGSTTSSPALK